MLGGLFRGDSWRSLFGSFGGRGDRGRADQIRLVPNAVLDDNTLSIAYRDLWLVRRLVEARTDDALRSGWGVTETEKLPEFTRLNTATHPEGAFQRACHMADLKGGAGLFIGYKDTGDQSLLEPPPANAEVAFLEVFDKFQLQGMERSRDVNAPDFDQPQIWQVVGPRRSGLTFHTSRLIRFPGDSKPTDLGEDYRERDWGHSRLQSVWEDVVRYGVFWQSLTHLMQVASVGKLKLKGLIELLATRKKADAEARIDLLNETLSSNRLFLLDAGQNEDYSREAVAFSDIPALLQELQLNTAGAFHMPATKLFGRAPAGLNATGDADMRNWYDEVQEYQQSAILPRLSQVISICERREVDIDFKPLWQPTEQEQATTRQTLIAGNERLWTMEVVDSAEIRKAMIEGKCVEDIITGPPPKPEIPPAPPQPQQPPPAPKPLPANTAEKGDAKEPAPAPTIVVNVPAPVIQAPAPATPPTAEEVADELEKRHGLSE